jgi:PAS domain S-box-containing protein
MNSSQLTILIIDPNSEYRSHVQQALDRVSPSLSVIEVQDHESLTRRLTLRPIPELVVTTLTLGTIRGEALMDQIRFALPQVPLLVLFEEEESEVATDLLRSGIAYAALPKAHEHLDRLPSLILTTLEHAAAQRAAREAEQRFMRMAENAPDMIFRWSYARGFEYVNPASTEVVGYTPEEHYADPGLSYRVIHPDDIPVYESVFSDLADPEGARRYCVVRWVHKDGHLVHIEMRMAPLFDDRGELIAIEGIARDISQHVIARERLRELTSRLTQAQEEERRRIARELHDEIGQALTIMKMRLRFAENALPAGEEGSSAHEKLEVLGGLVEDTLATVRALSQELRPPLLDELGWDAALSWLCDSFSQRTGLAVHYSREGQSRRLDGEVELAAYRVVQESLTNIARHAEADLVQVSAAISPESLHLTIMDDGCGFDLEALHASGKPRSGLGLLGMQERAEPLGGKVTVTSQPGDGTRIEVLLPAQPAKEED